MDAATVSDKTFSTNLTHTSSSFEISIVMPCLNEAETVRVCIEKARNTLDRHGIRGEIIVADNGSTDDSQGVAESAGARVVNVRSRGYGAALAGGIEAASGTYIIMGDADDSYDFSHLPLFLEQLRAGYDLVMGNRFLGGIKNGAMPPLHRYLGNPVLTGIGRLFFKAPCGDFHCGLRAFSKEAYRKMGLRTTGMEFASEMVVKATLSGMKITEVPTTLSPDGRTRAPHLRSWRDGWRHLRFLLLYSPRWLFLYPGFAAMLVGIIAGIWLLLSPRRIGAIVLDFHSLLYAAALVIVGFQSVTFAMFTKVFAISEGLLPPDRRLDKLFRYITLEAGIIGGAALLLSGFAGSVYAVHRWQLEHFGPINPGMMLRIIIPSILALTIGVQTILSSFFLSVLGLRRHGRMATE
jgi:glycosyltransferase involved in cell wall biosynthesis